MAERPERRTARLDQVADEGRLTDVAHSLRSVTRDSRSSKRIRQFVDDSEPFNYKSPTLFTRIGAHMRTVPSMKTGGMNSGTRERARVGASDLQASPLSRRNIDCEGPISHDSGGRKKLRTAVGWTWGNKLGGIPTASFFHEPPHRLRRRPLDFRAIRVQAQVGFDRLHHECSVQTLTGCRRHDQ